MAFNAKEYFAALEPPVYIDKAGQRHEGRILSIFEMGRVEESLKTPDKETPDAWRVRCASVLAELFPGNQAVIDEILDLPAEAFGAAFADFFAHQRRRISADAPV